MAQTYQAKTCSIGRGKNPEKGGVHKHKYGCTKKLNLANLL